MVMTRTIEDLLAASMRDEVAGLRPAPDLVARAAQKYRRRARFRLAASAAGAAGIAAAVAVGLTVASPGPSAVRPGSGAARADGQDASSPQTRLVAAMTSSAQLSYRLHLINTSTTPDHRTTPTSPPRDLIIWYADYTGVYDPATRLGAGINTIRLQSGTFDNPGSYGQADGYMQVRIVGDNYYTRFSGNNEPWRTAPGTLVQALVLNGGRAWAPTDGASADPAVLLAAVRQLGSVTFVGQSGSGAQALDVYKFSYDIAGDGSVEAHQLTGTITVHDQSNLIAEITMQTTVTGASSQVAEAGSTTFTTVMTFSDYGVLVRVQAPAGAVLEKSPASGA
jgi:hypothetical protein